MSQTFGHFDDRNREYVITNPATPRPWHNFLYNEEYLVNITQTGMGASFYQPTGEGLRANLTEDRDGNGGPRLVYLRDDETGKYWSLTGSPGLPEFTSWECRVGMGYQVNRSRNESIEAAWTLFVPPGRDSCEFWKLEVTNRSKRVRRISVTPYVEMHLTGGSTLMDFIAVLGGHFDPDARAVFGINSCVKFPPKFKAFLASDRPVASATVSRDEFLGAYRNYHNPIAVETGKVHNPQAGTEWIGASLRHALELQPGQTATIHCLLGICDSVDSGKQLIAKYLAAGKPAEVWQEIRSASDALCGTNTVKSKDVQFDRWYNQRLKLQLHFVARWGRVIGRGYRDILQDIFGHRLSEPAMARKCILEVFSKQFPSGKCIRAWRLPTAELDLQDYADSPSWMIMALSQYLKETGDFAVLDERVPFLNAANPYAAPDADATVLEHVTLAQRYLLKHLGSHGLSKIYYGDWCDTMNGVGRQGRGESVMLSMQVKWGCDLLAELADRPELASRLGREAATLAGEMRAAAASLHQAINTVAWDGQWYLRAFDDDGLPVGSSNPPASDGGEGKIFLNAQSWAVISGVADPARTDSALASANKYLDCGYGMVLNYPAFTSLKPRIGQMTAMTPGFYENGSVYVHGNCFWIYALVRAGRGGEAWKAMQAILPDTPNKPNGDTEPFIIPNYYIGPNVQRRMQRNLYLSGWRTGSAAWLFVTMAEWILGLRADYDALLVDPHLPDQLGNEVEVTREFRGVKYKVRYERAGSGGSVAGITVNGKPITGNRIPCQKSDCRVVVTLR